MKIKPGVSIHGLDQAFQFIWPVIQATYHQYGMIERCVLTCGTERVDEVDRVENSLHKIGRAIDIRLPYDGESDNKRFLETLQERMHEEFTIAFHEDHFHVEYHPSETSYFPVQAKKYPVYSNDQVDVIESLYAKPQQE